MSHSSIRFSSHFFSYVRRNCQPARKVTLKKFKEFKHSSSDSVPLLRLTIHIVLPGGPGWSVIFPIDEGIDVIEQLSCTFYFFTRDFPLLSWSFDVLTYYQIRRLIFYSYFHFSAVTNLVDPETEGTDNF
jgi:hypothetical protein